MKTTNFGKVRALIFSGAVALAMLTNSAVFAAGGGSTGGGDKLVAQFESLTSRLLSYDYTGILPVAVYGTQQAGQRGWDYKMVNLLTTTLDQAKVRSVRILFDPKTGAPIPNQDKMVAWSGPGFIQLKQQNPDRPDESSWESVAQDRDESVAQYIVHELYRASGLVDSTGKSPDENFQISVGQLHLDKVRLAKGTYAGVQSGNYSSYSQVCGVHVEKNEGTLILTTANNPYYADLPCLQAGMVWTYECNQCGHNGQAWSCSSDSANFCSRHNGDQLVDMVQILEDGSLLSTFTGIKYIY